MVTRESKGKRERRGSQGFQVSLEDQDQWGPKENQWSVPLVPLGRQALLVYQAMASLVLLDLLGHQDLQGPLGHP